MSERVGGPPGRGVARPAVTGVTMAVLTAIVITGCGSEDGGFGPPGSPFGGGAEPATLVISSDSNRVAVDGTMTMVAMVLDSEGSPLTVPAVSWGTSDEAVLTIDAQGVVTGVSQGDAMVMASLNELDASADIEVRGHMIGSGGGTASSPDGRATVTVPEEAVDDPTVIVIEDADPEETPTGPSADGYVDLTAYTFHPAGVTFDGAVTVTIDYDEGSIPVGIPESSIRLKQAVEGGWTAIAGASVDIDANRVTAEVEAFALFGAVGQDGNDPPQANITSPDDQTSVNGGVMVTLSGSGLDTEDGSLIGATLNWYSNLDGYLGSGETVLVADLSIGTHTITLEATDSQGVSATAEVELDILNNLPSVSITAPGSGSILVRLLSGSFEGSCNDVEDGALLGLSLEWSSSINLAFGSGESLVGVLASLGLSLGVHTVTLSCTDSHGGVGTASITITVI